MTHILCHLVAECTDHDRGYDELRLYSISPRPSWSTTANPDKLYLVIETVITGIDTDLSSSWRHHSSHHRRNPKVSKPTKIALIALHFLRPVHGRQPSIANFTPSLRSRTASNRCLAAFQTGAAGCCVPMRMDVTCSGVMAFEILTERGSAGCSSVASENSSCKCSKSDLLSIMASLHQHSNNKLDQLFLFVSSI